MVVANIVAVAVVVAAVVVTNQSGNFVGPGFGKDSGLSSLFLAFPFVRLSIMSEQHIEVEGSITAVLPGTMFRVQLDNKHPVLATICGKMRKRWVRLTVGDRVKMEMSPYDLDKARITWRLK